MSVITGILRWLFGIAVACGLTLALFLVLPILQSISEKEQDQYVVQDVNVIQQETPPDIPEPEPEPEEPEETPEEPELDTEPLVNDITQLDLAFDGIGGFGIPGADTSINIDSFVDSGEDADQLFELDELDQDPRVLYQASPKMTSAMRRAAPATVIVVFVVDERGRVGNAAVQSSSDPSFDRAALEAVKQWRFEPGQSKGQPVESRMRIPITFPKE